MLFCYYFFFFQAEDGIRDLYVTGVLTCALPISGPGTLRGRTRADRRMPARRRRPRCGQRAEGELGERDAPDPGETGDVRSEERRVGKECRSRWWRDQ